MDDATAIVGAMEVTHIFTIIAVAFGTGSGALRVITITNGSVGSEEIVSTALVLQNPDIAKNDGAVAHLALGGTTIHALWSDLATGDIKHSSREQGKARTTRRSRGTRARRSRGGSTATFTCAAGGAVSASPTTSASMPMTSQNIAYNEITLGP